SESAPSYAAVRRSEPKQLAGLLRSELDWIVMKSLDKDRNRRYETASSFSQDISRYLIGDAVHAHPPTLVYRLRKYAVKNRQLFVFFASIFTVLVASTAVSAWFGFAAIRSRDDAIEAGKIANEKRREATLAGNRAAEEADRAKKLAAVAERSSNASLFALGMAQAAQGRVKEAIDSFDSVDPSYRNVEWQLGQQLVGGSARTWNLRQPFQISGDAELLVRQTDQKAMVSSLKEGKQTSIFSINGNVSRLSNDGSCLLTTEKTTDDAKIVFHSYYVNDGSKLCTIGPIEESWKFEVTNRYILFTCREHPEILRIHDVVDGRELKVLEFDEDVEQIVCNELRIALLVGNTVELLDAEDLAETRSIEPDDDSYFGRIAMTRDGALLCAGSNDALEIFSLGSKVSRMKTLHKKPGSADVLEFSPDGSYVAVVNGGYSKVGSDPDPQIEVIERESERSRFFSGHVGISIDALWFADEDLQFLTLGEDGLLKLWNERSPVVEFAVRADDELTRAVTFSPDSTRLLSGGSNCTVVCWDARSGSKMWELDAGREVIDVAWLPNSRSCLAATDQRLLHLDASTGTVLECILDLSEAASTITCLSTSSKREYAAIGLSDGMVEIWKTNPLRKIADKPFDGRIQCLELNEQKKLAYVSYFPMPEGFQRAEQLAKSGTACWQWDPSLKEMSWVRSWGCKSISVDPVTSVVACGSARGQINTLDFLARENKELSSTFGNRNSSVSWTSGPNEQSRKVSGPTLRFTNDGSRLVASGNGGRLVVYDHVASRELFVTNVSDASTLSGWSTHLNDIDISDDGQRIAIAAGDFHTVKIINLDSSWKSVGLPRWEAVSSE
ncbi:MAG: hypothetical protein KDB03_28105, partial [Planctomycetales bacterium]|nr:hypothetical protein [Planctomycetales bacterium]